MSIYLLAEVRELSLIGALGRALPDMHGVSFSFPDGVLDRAVVCIPTEAELRVVVSKIDGVRFPRPPTVQTILWLFTIPKIQG